MLGDTLYDAIRNWEPRRPAYNLALAVLASAWILLTWPHFRAVLAFASPPELLILAALANVCYCAAYPVNVPVQQSAFANTLRRRRRVLWLVGTLFALLIAYFWIADEVYPFVATVKGGTR
jgi:cytochrome bd-type quinol oxidase subunit 2